MLPELTGGIGHPCECRQPSTIVPETIVLVANSMPHPLIDFFVGIRSVAFGSCVLMAAAMMHSAPAHAQKSGGAVGGTIGGAIGRTIGKGAVNSSFSDEQLRDAALQTNLALPKMVDEATRLDRVAAEPGKRMVFFNTLTAYRSADVDLGRFYTEFAPRIRLNACTNANTRRMLDAGVAMEWTYRGNEGGHVGTVRTTGRDCG
jgi:hypothetical protein